MREPKKLRNEAAAKRLHDTVATHQAVLGKDGILSGRFIAVRLADGGSDGVAYDSREEAIRHNTNNPSRCAYLQLPLERWSVATCDTLLWYVRACYDSGYREDPAHALILPTRVEDLGRVGGRGVMPMDINPYNGNLRRFEQ